MAKSISAKRKYDSIELKFWRKIKKSVKLVKSLFLDEDFVESFKFCFPNLWEEVCDFHKDMIRWNRQRIVKHLNSVYLYHSPEQFLIRKSSNVGFVQLPTSINKNEYIQSIRRDSLTKLKKRIDKMQQRERYKQHVAPSYVASHTKAYYLSRKQNPQDIDSRYLIVHELSKYKCDETIRFLKALVQCEKNIYLQHYAWECLNSLGITGVHKGRRSGKKKMSHTKEFKAISTPHDLLKAIYNSPLEQMKHYDLFLSHSYRDKEKLIELKGKLNALGLNVYMDWVNDKDELLRSQTSADTAAVITERIKASKAILYVHTNSSLDSKWTPWELGFAYAIGQPILVYRPEKTNNDPEYLQLYKSVIWDGDKLLFDDEYKTPVVDWLSNYKKSKCLS